MTKKARRPAARRKKAAPARVRRTSAKRSVKRAVKKGRKRAVKKAQPAATRRARASKAPTAKAGARTGKAPAAKAAPNKADRPSPHLERPRRTLDDDKSGVPSSLDMVRRGTSARTGRAEMAESVREHQGMSPDITGGDPDVDVEDAYFSGDEAPGGDNPTPDQDIVDDIGRALGVEYQDAEELKPVDKVTERDRKRWELDPASSEDYRERK